MQLGFKWIGFYSTVVFILVGIGMMNAELYTAIVHLEELVETSAVLNRALDEYISRIEHGLTLLKRHAAKYSREHGEAISDVSAYVSNPINAYLLVKRLNKDWKQTEKLMIDLAQEVEQNMTQYRQILKFPTDEDLSGAAVALMRLQDTYKLDTSLVAQGELDGVQYSTQLSSDDCFELGRQSYYNQDFYHTVLWMSESLRRHDQDKNRTSIERWEILEYLAYSTYMQGDVRSALQMTDELLTIVPTHQRALGNKAFYQEAINKEVPSSETDEPQEAAPKEDSFPLETVYEELCRKARSPSEKVLSKLKCRYVHRDEAYLRIAPLKEEEAYLKPRIVLYHDVIYDGEMELIKKMASPRLRRAEILESQTGKAKNVSHRITKAARLGEHEDPLILKISQRVEHMTSLTTKTAERYQAANYGIGGYYRPHCDFFSGAIPFTLRGFGNRIATVLFYMSDVAQGGATVFPHLDLALWPEKGMAAFWYNLHPSGKGDEATLHAACPVLVGSKWVLTKWIHEVGQEFRRPCSLEEQVLDESS